MTRERLPNRRGHELLSFEHGGIHYIAGVGRFENGDLAEIFLNTRNKPPDRIAQWMKMGWPGDLPPRALMVNLSEGYARFTKRSLPHTWVSCATSGVPRSRRPPLARPAARPQEEDQIATSQGRSSPEEGLQ
jgi:hypothetical protein